MYRIFLTDEFLKQLHRIESPVRKKIDKKIVDSIAPQLAGEPHFGRNIRKLRNFKPETWRYRIGNYRIFYIIDEEEKTIALVSIDHRNDAY